MEKKESGYILKLNLYLFPSFYLCLAKGWHLNEYGSYNNNNNISDTIDNDNTCIACFYVHFISEVVIFLIN